MCDYVFLSKNDVLPVIMTESLFFFLKMNVSSVIQSVLGYYRHHQKLCFISQHAHFLESETTPIILSSWLPLIPRVLPSHIFSGSPAVKVQRRWCTYCMWLSEKPGEVEVFFPHSGTFLSSLCSSHTFLEAWGELRSARSGCYIPEANTCPLIIVIEETRQLSGQSWMGGWMPCHSHSL